MSAERKFMMPVPYFAANATTLDKQRETVAALEAKVRSEEFLRLPKQERLAVEAELRTARHELNRMESEAMHKPASRRQTAQQRQQPEEKFLRVIASNDHSYLCERVQAERVVTQERRFMPIVP